MNKICVIIPTYNNCGTLGSVISDTLVHAAEVIVVDDGSTDATQELLGRWREKVQVISYTPNRGKGYALGQGFEAARKRGFDYAITIDADGQHAAADIEIFGATIKQHPRAMIVGSRCINERNMPRANTFANRFSNFWFAVQTLRCLPDTQSGYRAYPLAEMATLRPLTSRYECELEILVRLAWRGVELRPIPVSVYYPPEGERVSHFRPGVDFARISLLNTALTALAIIYGYPSMLWHKIVKKERNG